MKTPNNSTKYEVLIKQYLRSILDISEKMLYQVGVTAFSCFLLSSYTVRTKNLWRLMTRLKTIWAIARMNYEVWQLAHQKILTNIDSKKALYGKV